MKAILLVMLLFAETISFGQQILTDNDGKKVLLKADKTWEYLIEGGNKDDKLDGFDFRKTLWGMSKEQVKQTEVATLVKDEVDVVIYSDIVASLNSFIMYFFVDNKLVRARYAFIEKHTNKNDFIFDFKKVNDALIDKYGNPISDKEYWSDDLYKSDYDQRGFAVSLGHLKFFTTWETNLTTITSALTGDNYKIQHIAEYVSIRLNELEKNKKKEKSKSEF